MSDSPITVLLVDDHPMVREGLQAMISAETDIRVIGEAGNGEEAIRQYLHLRPMVMLLDLLLPDISGTEVITPTHGESERRSHYCGYLGGRRY